MTLGVHIIHKLQKLSEFTVYSKDLVYSLDKLQYQTEPQGDTKTIETNHLDLTTCTVPRRIQNY